MASYDETGEGGTHLTGDTFVSLRYEIGEVSSGLQSSGNSAIQCQFDLRSISGMGLNATSSVQKIVRMTASGGNLLTGLSRVGRTLINRGNGGSLLGSSAPYVRFYWPRPRGGVVAAASTKVNWFLYSNGKKIQGGVRGGTSARYGVIIRYYDRHWVMGGTRSAGKGFQTYNEPIMPPGVYRPAAGQICNGTAIVDDTNPGQTQVISFRWGLGGVKAGGSVYPVRDAVHRPLKCNLPPDSGMSCRIKFPPEMVYVCSKRQMINGGMVAAVVTCRFRREVRQSQNKKWSKSNSSMHAHTNSLFIS